MNLALGSYTSQTVMLLVLRDKLGLGLKVGDGGRLSGPPSHTLGLQAPAPVSSMLHKTGSRTVPRTFGEFYVVIVCTILDVIVLPSCSICTERSKVKGTLAASQAAKAMLLMTVPGISLHQIYAVPTSGSKPRDL